MSGLKKAARKVSKIGAKVLGTALGGVVAGPFGAVAGYKIGDEIGDSLSKASGERKPAAAPVLAMPDEEEIRRSQRRALASRAARSGRSSTILSGADEPLG